MDRVYHLSSGDICLTGLKAYSQDLCLDSFFSVAERINPKRPFLFVSKVLGRHIPVKPSVLLKSTQSLVSLMPRDITGKVLVVGMAETATGLGAFFAEQLQEAMKDIVDVTYRHSTRHDIGAPSWCEFKEPHSHATDHILYPLDDDLSKFTTLIIVDDEMTTGTTTENLASALIENGLVNIQRCFAVTLKDWCQRPLFCGELAIERVTLLSGAWVFEQRHGNSNKSIDSNAPTPEERKSVAIPLLNKEGYGRLRFSPLSFNKNDVLLRWPTIKNEKVLVLGCGEHSYLPAKLALCLEQLGVDVVFSAMSRSPIKASGPIKSKVEGVSPYDMATPFFMYNVTSQLWGRVIVCLDTNERTFPVVFKQALKQCSTHVEYIYDQAI